MFDHSSIRPATQRSLGRLALLVLAPFAALPLACDPSQVTSPELIASTQAAVSVGTTADGFAVLAGSTVTSTGPTAITGDLGVSPGTAITGFPPGIVSAGTTHAGDAVAQQAQTDATTKLGSLAAMPCNVNLTGQDLGGHTLTPGVYCFPATSAALTGQLTLDAQGDPSAIFVFQIGSSLTTASGSSVVVVDGGPGQGCNVLWQVGSSATLGSAAVFVGSILAKASITVGSGVSVSGRLLAQTGAVTLIDDQVSPVTCAVVVDAGTGATSSSAAGTGGATTSSSSSGAGGAATSSSSSAGASVSSSSSSSSSSAGKPSCGCVPEGGYCKTDSHCCHGTCNEGICGEPRHGGCHGAEVLGSPEPPYGSDDEGAAVR